MSHNEKTPAVNHLAYLDGLRAVAATYVVFFHALNDAVPKPDQFAGALPWILNLFNYGHYSVDLFIVLSGFCLMMPAAKNNNTLRDGALNFFKRRAWRILPPYYAAMMLSLLLIWLFLNQKTGNGWDPSLPVTGKSVFTHLILMQDAFGEDYTINHAFWSISVEWRIYFLLPLLLIGWRKLGPVKTAILAIVTSRILFNVFQKFIGCTLTAQYLGLFTMGLLAASIVFSSQSPSQLRKAPWGRAAIAMAAVVFVLIPLIQSRTPINVCWVDYCVGLLSMSILVTAALNERGWLCNLLSWKPLAFIGTFAYSIYLIHAPLLQFFWQYLFAPIQKTPLLIDLMGHNIFQFFPVKLAGFFV